MTQDVTQWLAEIQALRQQLAATQKEREQAYASAVNWQRLYETEAQQRRADTSLARQRVEDLRQEVQQLQVQAIASDNESAILAAIQAEVEQLPAAALREKLIAALLERERLVQALKAEQTSHAQTRQSLTTALGDAIDLLAKEQQS